jgi:hypothetical protein
VNGIGNGSVALANVTITGGTVSNVSGVVPTPFTANGVVYASTTSALATGSGLVFDGSNLGLGVTPTTVTNGPVIQGKGATIQFYGTSELDILQNAYYNGGYKYLTTGAASFYIQASGGHYWASAPSGTAGNAITFTQTMTLNNSGNLSIGTTSTLNYGAGGTYKNLSIDGGTSADARGEISLAGGGGGANYNLGRINFGLSSNTTNAAAGINCFSSASGASTGGILVFSTASDISSSSYTERARIDSSGNLLVGITSGSYHKFNISNSSALMEMTNSNASPVGLYVTYSTASPNGTTNEFLICRDTTVNRALIRSNGGLANYSANNVNLSDRREKTNFAPAKSYLETICAIPIQTFNYIDQNLEEDPGLTLGVVAQDVQAVAPELVMESNWAGKDDEPKMRLSIYQTDLQYALMKCIQEQQALIQSLTDRLAALESK